MLLGQFQQGDHSLNSTNDLRFRQVHLDFHTSEHIPGVGSEFDPDRFVYTLKQASVDSVTLFSRCHHGWTYHDSKFNIRHPHLTCDLLAEQIRACHKADIRCPIYITVGWDDRIAREEPGWIEVHEDGKINGSTPLEPGWNKLCFASPYVDFVQAQTDEVLEMFGDEVDGLFFDIMFISGVHSQWALKAFEAMKLNPAVKGDRDQYRAHMLQQTVERISGTVRSRNQNCTMFFNSGHVSPHFKSVIDAHYSHLEVESLPTGGWGYSHFPIAARYSRTLGKQFLGMTGKFGETWGHFNSYKPQAALEYECRLMVAMGGRCSVGDQLHPSGELDQATYNLIGYVYSQVAALEPWHRDAKPVADIAVVHTEPYTNGDDRVQNSNLGAYRILTEGRHQFDFVDEKTDLANYRVLILPDMIPVSPEYGAKIAAFVKLGGSLLLTGSAGLNPEGTEFAIPGSPGSFKGPADFSPSFLQTSPDLAPECADRQFVVYSPMVVMESQVGSTVLADVYEPYFTRNYKHFCSHAHAPVKGKTMIPGALQKGQIIQLAASLFTEYAEHPALEVKQVILSALARLLPVPMVSLAGPSTIQLHALGRDHNLVVHVMNYLPERRGTRLDIVEDRLPVRATELKVRGVYQSAISLPNQSPLPIRSHNGTTCVALPDFDGSFVVYLAK